MRVWRVVSVRVGSAAQLPVIRSTFAGLGCTGYGSGVPEWTGQTFAGAATSLGLGVEVWFGRHIVLSG